MVNAKQSELLSQLVKWLQGEATVEAAVLYGSSARAPGELAAADCWSDFDLHIITSSANRFELIDWGRVMPDQGFCLQSVRPAAGGVRKARVLFAAGAVEMVLMPARKMRLARFAVTCGLHRKFTFLQDGLNVLATGLRSGYRFLKGEKSWGKFYAQVVTEMPGIRVGENETIQLADGFIFDMLTGLQRLDRGELVAAQRVLQRLLVETNFILTRELRLRRGLPVPSFEPGRRVEALLSPSELGWVRAEARLDKEELNRAMWRAFEGLQALMHELTPAWVTPLGVNILLAPYSTRPSQT